MRRIIILTLMILLSSSVVGQSTAEDWLLYFENTRQPAGVNAYNPATGETIELPVFADLHQLKTSGDGRIAYIQDNDVWVLDVLNAPYAPINISQTPDEQESLIGWTPDGHFLEFLTGGLRYTYDGNEVLAVAYGDERRYWNENGWYIAIETVDSQEVSYVWNGQERIELDLSMLPPDIAERDFRWIPDNHFFITLRYNPREFPQPIGPTAVFYWNGEMVQEVENPSDDETFLVGHWSNDGRLTLFTSQDFFDRWYIWDGVSFTEEGVPDTSTLVAINSSSEIIADYGVQWMPDGRLAIVTRGNPDSDTLLGHPYTCIEPCMPQVFLWDTDSMRLVVTSERPHYLIDVHENGNIAVFEFNGINIFSVTVFDPTGQQIFQSRLRPPYSRSRWSADGNLAFCFSGISVWNGQEMSTLNTSTVEARWLLVRADTLFLSSHPVLNCSAG